MFKVFKQSYPGPAPFKRRFIVSIGISAFVFLFLFVFQPFLIGTSDLALLTVTAGFGLTCFFTLTLINAFVEVFPGVFSEKNWTVGKEIISTLGHIGLIGLANAFYAAWVFKFDFTPSLILTFEGYTLAVGILPVLLLVLLKYQVLRNRFENASNLINNSFNNRLNKVLNRSTPLVITENNEIQLSLPEEALVYAAAADNYVEFFYLDGNELKKKVLRKTLKQTMDELENFKSFAQVHRSYIANLDLVIHVSGNAQGLKLHFESTDFLVPVSRKLTQSLKERFENRPT